MALCPTPVHIRAHLLFGYRRDYTCGYENCEPGHSYGPILRNRYLIHFLLARKFPGSQVSSNEKQSDHVKKALKYIEACYCDPITIQDIADPLYFSRIFHQKMGVSPSEYRKNT